MSASKATYLDSSALVKLAVRELESTALRRYLRRADGRGSQPARPDGRATKLTEPHDRPSRFTNPNPRKPAQSCLTPDERVGTSPCPLV
jgi:hypothetical protein